jgi:hypothetical protein
MDLRGSLLLGSALQNDYDRCHVSERVVQAATKSRTVCFPLVKLEGAAWLNVAHCCTDEVDQQNLQSKHSE